MLSSRYAPIVALTAFAVIVVGLLGWFLAIKPQVDETSAIGSMENEVRANAEQILLASAQIDQYEETLAELPKYEDSITLNAPSTFDEQAIRARIAQAFEGTEAELVSVEQASAQEIEGWELPANSLPSASVATLFQTGPVHPEVEGEVFSPAVTPAAADEEGTSALMGVPVTITVVGASQAVLDLLGALEDPEQQLFQVHTVDIQARPDTSGAIPGVENAETGDATLILSGYFYLHEPDLTIEDPGALGDGSLGGATPFVPIGGAAAPPEDEEG